MNIILDLKTVRSRQSEYRHILLAHNALRCMKIILKRDHLAQLETKPLRLFFSATTLLASISTLKSYIHAFTLSSSSHSWQSGCGSHIGVILCGQHGKFQFKIST